MSSLPQSGTMDSQFDAYLDLSVYESNGPYQSRSLSPTDSKVSFPPSIKTEAPPATSLMSTSQPLSGPSHQYDLYKQQTGLVPGALASTFEANENNPQIQGYSDFNIAEYMAASNTSDVFDFNTDLAQPSLDNAEMDMDFNESSPESYHFDKTINPNSIGGQEPSALPSPPMLPTQSGNVGRVWPGMHQQAALAKAQAQQRQQQRQALQPQPKQHQRAKSAAQATDPLVEQKITQLLNSMRANSTGADGSQNGPHMNMPRLRKDEADMDEDERLLASEEGKKLTSKERRQLRNKVSARAFRSRRKEYISQLEAEIASKVTENGDLRAQNRALIDENKRLTDLTRMLLSSSSFSDFLNHMSANPQQLPSPPTQAQPQPQPQEVRQMPKDPNPYAAQQRVQQHQQIGMVMIPEQNMDFSMLAINNGDAPTAAFNFPQVYMVEAPEQPIDTSMLTGKTTNFVGLPADDEDSKLMPVVEPRPTPSESESEKRVEPVVDEEFENDPAFALYHDSPAAARSESAPVELDLEPVASVDIFGGVESEKMLARFELVGATEEEEAGEDEVSAALALARLDRLNASLESIRARLEMLTSDL